MDDHLQEALGKLLDVYDARRRADVEREQKAKDEEARLLSDFAVVRRHLIRPGFEAAGEGRISEAAITMRIVPSGTKAPLHEDQRSLTIATRHYNKTVWINTGESAGSGGLAGAKGAFALDKGPRQLVEEELIGFVARVVTS